MTDLAPTETGSAPAGLRNRPSLAVAYMLASTTAMAGVSKSGVRGLRTRRLRRHLVMLAGSGIIIACRLYIMRSGKRG